MHWWLPPEQRQRWGDSRTLPTSTLSQIFFDLFYVAGAINLGTLLKNSRDPHGILYFVGTGFAIMMIWFDKMRFDARFATPIGRDVVHRCLEVLQIGLVATALSRIRPAAVMSDACNHTDMLEFSGSLCLSSIVTMYRYIEIMCFSSVTAVDPGARVAARMDVQWKIVPTLLFLVATVDSFLSYFGNDPDACQRSDLPIQCCLAAWFAWIVVGYCCMVIYTPKDRGETVKVSVPMNIQFCMHRYGEWFMLMFGESIISLLIVDGNNESFDYNVSFFSGILSIVVLAHLHFALEPHEADAHALGRSRRSSFVYSVIVPVYSVALIAIGVSYKMFLYEFIIGYYDGDAAAHRLLVEDGQNNHGSVYDSYYEQEKRQQFAANLFCASIATVMICADLILLVHKGVPEVIREARTLSSRSLIIFILTKLVLLVLLAILIIVQNDPHVVAFCGLAAIVSQELWRGLYLFHTTVQKPNDTTAAGDHPADLSKPPEAFINVSTWLSTMSALPGHARNESTRERVLALFERKGLVETENTLAKCTQEDITQSVDDVRVAGDYIELA